MQNSCLPCCLFLGCFAVVAACASGNDMQVLASGPQGITLRYKEDNRQLAGVTADEHCANYGKVSQFVRQKDSRGLEAVEDPGTTVFMFACVDPAAVQ